PRSWAASRAPARRSTCTAAASRCSAWTRRGSPSWRWSTTRSAAIRATEAGAVVELPTPHGVARAHLRAAGGAAGALVLGHGAGGGVGAPDLGAATDAALAAGVAVA